MSSAAVSGIAQLTRQLPRDEGVVHDQGGVRADRGAAGERRDPGEQPGRQLRSGDVRRVGVGDGALDRGPGHLRRQGVRLGDRHADEDRAAEPQPEVDGGEPRRAGDVGDRTTAP